MSAGLGFKNFVTGDVLTAGDANGYLMQGIWVFANATARDAAVTSPQEGNACYLKDTDAILVYSGSAWVVKSSSGTAGGTLLDTVNLTSGNSQSSASLSGSYDNLVIYMEDFYASGGSANVGLRFNSDSGSNYTSAGIRNSSSGSPAAVGNSASDRAYFIDQTEANQTNNFAIINVPNYKAATLKGFNGSAQFKDSQYFTKSFNAVWNSSSAITTIQFVTSGTWVAGTAKIYGVNR